RQFDHGGIAGCEPRDDVTSGRIRQRREHPVELLLRVHGAKLSATERLCNRLVGYERPATRRPLVSLRRVRIITGAAKGRRLVAPDTRGTRPATDRVREAVFSSLGPFVVGADVLDLYAGSGSY